MKAKVLFCSHLHFELCFAKSCDEDGDLLIRESHLAADFTVRGIPDIAEHKQLSIARHQTAYDPLDNLSIIRVNSATLIARRLAQLLALDAITEGPCRADPNHAALLIASPPVFKPEPDLALVMIRHRATFCVKMRGVSQPALCLYHSVPN